jgi:hypothetical protein
MQVFTNLSQFPFFSVNSSDLATLVSLEGKEITSEDIVDLEILASRVAIKFMEGEDLTTVSFENQLFQDLIEVLKFCKKLTTVDSDISYEVQKADRDYLFVVSEDVVVSDAVCSERWFSIRLNSKTGDCTAVTCFDGELGIFNDVPERLTILLLQMVLENLCGIECGNMVSILGEKDEYVLLKYFDKQYCEVGGYINGKWTSFVTKVCRLIPVAYSSHPF